MTPQSILVAGLPASGKTTFLAALWHTVRSRDIATALRLHSLKSGNFSHLNDIARKWCEVVNQERTEGAGQELVTMLLTADGNETIELTFPDLSGEDFRDLWEERDCSSEFLAAAAGSNNLLFFVHSDKIHAPHWVINQAALLAQLGMPANAQLPVDWSPRMAPTQVQIVDILQLLRNSPFGAGPGKLGFVFSAWDKAKEDNLSPADFLAVRLPLVSQYLEANSDYWDHKVFGISAIGGDITPAGDSDTEKARAKAVAEELREIDVPCQRIEVVGLESSTHDLTTILQWLLA